MDEPICCRFGLPPCQYSLVATVGDNYDDFGEIDEHKDQDVDAEACVPVDEKYQALPTVRCADLPTVKVASVIHHGAYNTLTQSYQMVLKWVEANGYPVHGPIREIYLQCGKPLR